MRKVFIGSTDIVFIFLSLFLISLTGNEKRRRKPLSCVKICLRYISSKIEDNSCIIVTFSNKIGKKSSSITKGGSRTAATFKMELFVIIVNGFQPLTIITKSSILDVAAVLDPPLITAQS